MYQTKYHKPASVADAVAALGGAEDGKILSGGQTLIPTMKAHLAAPTDLIDVRGIEGMEGISVTDASITIGAATRHADVAGSSEVQAKLPALACLAAGIGDPAVRAVGTIGGSVANNDPAADYPSAVLALGASIITNTREIAADAFFQGMFATALEDDEIIVALRFPIPGRAGYAKFPNPASRYAMVGVFVAQTDDGARVAVTGAGSDGVFRASEMEEALAADFSPAALDGLSADADAMLFDVHGSAEYRAHLVSVMAKRAVENAV